MAPLFLKTILSWLVLLTAKNLLKVNLVSIPRFVQFMACQTTTLKFVTNYKKHCFPPGFKFFYGTTINNISGDTLSVQGEEVQPQKQSISPSFSLEDFSMLIDLTKQAKRRMCQSVIGMICKDRCVVGQSSIDVYKTYA
jgi:hypothetical protein